MDRRPQPFTFLDTAGLYDSVAMLHLKETSIFNLSMGAVPSYSFEIISSVNGTRLGNISLRVCENESVLYYGHIGYEVYPSYRGKRLALRACKLLMPLIQRHNMPRVVITCDPDNIASRRTIERLGARYKGCVSVPPKFEMYIKGESVKCVYELRLTNPR